MVYPQWASVPALSTLLADLVLENKRFRQHCYFINLSNDIIVDCLFPLLAVEELICLRRVNKLLFALSHEPIVWLRILERLCLPIIPPLSTRYRPGFKLPHGAAEQAVTRAITIDDSFRSKHTNVRASHKLRIPEAILEIKLLHGGKYLVASIGRRMSAKTVYYLAIMNVEAHSQEPYTTVAVSDELDSRAYCLDAKFMKFNDIEGIMITHVQRFWCLDPEDLGEQYAAFASESPPNIILDELTYDAYSGEKYPQEFESVSTFVSIDDLENMMKPDAVIPSNLDNIFKPVHYYRSLLRIYEPLLVEMDGMPYVVFTEQPRYTPTSQPPDEVVFLPLGLDVSLRTILVCQKVTGRDDWMHRIRQVRVLPEQRQVLAIRSTYHPQWVSQNVIELFAIPTMGLKGFFDCESRMPIPTNCLVRNFQVSDSYQPSTYSVNNRLPNPPISIYMITSNPQTITHYLLWPKKVDVIINNQRTVHWHYDLDQSIFAQAAREVDEKHNLRVIAGVHRSLIWGHDINDRSEHPTSVIFQRYISKGANGEVPTLVEPMLSRGRKPIPVKKLFAYIDNVNINTFPEFFEKGISNIAWDESIGRACVICGHTNTITVLDFAKTNNGFEIEARRQINR